MKIKIEIELDTDRDANEIQDLIEIVERIRDREEYEESQFIFIKTIDISYETVYNGCIN